MEAPTPTWDPFGRGVTQAEAQQQVMLGLYDLRVDASDAQFSDELVDDLETLRLKFLSEFETKFPGYGKGRAIWR